MLIALACGLLVSGPAAAKGPAGPQGCHQTLVRRAALSGRGRPDIIVVRAAGASCTAARISVVVRDATGRTLWFEESYARPVVDDRGPDEPGPALTFQRLEGLVNGWISLEKTSQAPAWPAEAETLPASVGQDPTQRQTTLKRPAYERIRAAREPMLCVVQGPESAHCIARDPASGRLVELFSGGI